MDVSKAVKAQKSAEQLHEEKIQEADYATHFKYFYFFIKLFLCKRHSNGYKTKNFVKLEVVLNV